MQLDISQEQNNDSKEKARSKEGIATSNHLYKILKPTKKWCLLFRYKQLEQKHREGPGMLTPQVRRVVTLGRQTDRT